MKKQNGKRAKITTIALFVVAVALLLTSVVGGTYAALTYYSENYRADAELYSIGVSLQENDKIVSWRNYTHADNVWDEASGKLLENMVAEDEALQFGYEYPEVLTAKNSGTIDEYVRVRVYRYWVDDEGNKLTKLDTDTIKVGFQSEGWLENPAERTAERTVLYYTSVLSPEQVTTAFAKTLAIDPEVLKITATVPGENDGDPERTVYIYKDQHFVLRAEVDAVQTHNAADAFKSAWGVTATFDANGNVTSVK